MLPTNPIPRDLDSVLLLFALFGVPRILQRYRLPTAITGVALGLGAGMGLGLFAHDATAPTKTVATTSVQLGVLASGNGGARCGEAEPPVGFEPTTARSSRTPVRGKTRQAGHFGEGKSREFRRSGAETASEDRNGTAIRKHGLTVAVAAHSGLRVGARWRKAHKGSSNAVTPQ
jgi:hypothetical protein